MRSEVDAVMDAIVAIAFALALLLILARAPGDEGDDEDK